MLRLSLAVVLLLGLGGVGCRSAESHASPSPKAEPSAPSVAAPVAAAGGHRQFGAEVPSGGAMTLGAILSKPAEFAEKTVTVEAKVRRNCTRRGCWMELAEQTDPSAPGCRVTFKDYGFFVPLDSAGSTARVQGIVHVQSVSAPEVAHLEGEGAKFASKQADGTAQEVRLVASGVELWREPG